MNIYPCLRKCLQHLFTDCGIYLHGGHRIVLSGTSRIYLECKALILVYMVDMLDNCFTELVKALILMQLDRTDTHDTKNS